MKYRGYDHPDEGIYVNPRTGNEIHKLPHPFKKKRFVWAAKFFGDPEVLLFDEFRVADEYLSWRMRYEWVRSRAIDIPPLGELWKPVKPVSTDTTNGAPTNT